MYATCKKSVILYLTRVHVCHIHRALIAHVLDQKLVRKEDNHNGYVIPCRFI